MNESVKTLNTKRMGAEENRQKERRVSGKKTIRGVDV